MVRDYSGIVKALMGEYEKTSQPLQERASILPFGQYEDGSVGMAWPGLLAAPVEGVANFGKYGYGEEAVPYNAGMAFDAAGGAMTGGFAAGVGGGLADNALGSAGGRIAASNPDLPMDLASRMARAKEMGFDTETPLYHGSNAQFDAFDLSKAGESTDWGFYGKGVYLTPHADEAKRYGSNVGEHYVRGKLADDAAASEAWQQAKSEGATDPRMRVAEILAERGYAGRDVDGVKSASFGSEAVIFDPRNIRSTQAAFDPAMSDSANLLAANAKTGAAIPAGMEASQDDQNPALIEYLRSMGLM